MDLAKDSTLTRTLMQNDKPKEFSGTYRVADDLLILRQGNQVAMTAQITWLAADRFNFRLADNDSSDPEIHFHEMKRQIVLVFQSPPYLEL